ncbi:MAG: 4'-phosphopantetheinyl transferase [Patiriisocius sp.]|jgi:4'-phosphopantetheinyl transferase
MSLIINNIIAGEDHLAVWHVTESLEELTERFFGKTPKGENWETYNALKLDKVKKQWLATRLAIRTISNSDPEITYDEHGAPWIQIEGWELSISHSAEWIAVLLSKNSMIGIDLQAHNSKITNIVNKFTHQTEYNHWLENESIDYLHALWTIKEAVYKCFKHSQAFKQIQITSKWPFASALVNCTVTRENRTYNFMVEHQKIGSFYLSHVRL